MRRWVSRAVRFLPALSLAGLIFYLSHQSRLPTPPLAFDGIDKILHAGIFALLTLSLLWGARWPASPAAVAMGVIAALYGLSDEWHQSYVPGREPDLLDLLADSAGAALVVAVHLRRRRADLRGTRPPE